MTYWPEDRLAEVRFCGVRIYCLLLIYCQTTSNRVCAIRMSNDSFRLLCIKTYMPYEGDEDMTDEFTNQLVVIENLIANNSDCHVIVGGDFNVDFS